MNNNYQKYLESDEWKKKRRGKFAVSKNKCCAICLSVENLQVHHLSYKNNLDEVPNWDLRILCNTCHQATHDLINSGKIKFTKNTHNHRFSITKNAVKKHLGLYTTKHDKALLKIKGYRQLSRSVFKIVNPEIVEVLTSEIIERGKSRHGAWNLAQFRLFGFDNFPKKGWKQMIIGQEWPRETISQFLYLKNRHLKVVSKED